MIETTTTLVFAALLVAAAASDVKSRRIPNVLVLAGLAGGLALGAAAGLASLAAAALGTALALVVVFPLFALGALGAGDAKLFMVVGAFMGPRGFLAALLVSALVGGALGLVAAFRSGLLLPLLVRTRDLAVNAVTLGRHGARPSLSDAGAVSVPYGVAIAIGSLAVWLG